MTETDGERTDATEVAGVVDKVARWNASRNGAEILGPGVGWTLRALCYLCSEEGKIGLLPGSAVPLRTVEETRRDLLALQEAGYFTCIVDLPVTEQTPNGGKGYVLNTAKILADPPPPEYPKGKVGYKVDLEKIFGCPLVKREKV